MAFKGVCDLDSWWHAFMNNFDKPDQAVDKSRILCFLSTAFSPKNINHPTSIE